MKDNHYLKKFSSESLTPEREFNNRAKNRFLAAFDARYGTRPAAVQPSGRSRSIWIKAVIGAASFAAIMVGVSAYADTANVAADSPLYPLKRLTENVQLAFTPASGQAQFEAALATRRANEIEDLSTRKPSSTLIAGLSVDFQNDISNSLKDIGNDGDNGNGQGSIAIETPISGISAAISSTASGTASAAAVTSDIPAVPLSKTATIVCTQVSNIISKSAVVRIRVLDDSALFQQFQSRCGADAGSSATATGTASASASTTIRIVPREQGRYGHFERDEEGLHSDADASSSASRIPAASSSSSAASSSFREQSGLHIPSLELGL